jgi:hypothetical protein
MFNNIDLNCKKIYMFQKKMPYILTKTTPLINISKKEMTIINISATQAKNSDFHSFRLGAYLRLRKEGSCVLWV